MPVKPRPPLPDGPFLVVGLARSGGAIARALAERGEEVVGVDRGSPPGAAGLEGAGVEIHTDADGSELLARVSTVVKSPGVPAEAPVVAAARERGMPVIGELEAAWRMVPNPFVAVTGTNGKTTVTELAGHIWRTAGKPVVVAGNVGTPLASFAGGIDPDATVVCECSSFQLEDTEAFAPECAVLLNITPDHLDRHGTLEAYLDAKLRIFANQGTGDVAVHPDLSAYVGEIPGDARGVPLERVDLPVEPAELGLLGAHNVANARAAAAAAAAMGIEEEAIAEGLRTFEGVPHRLERIAEIDGVLYVNDSKATNVAAAAAALRAFPDRGVRVILGGSLKGGDFTGLEVPIAERGVGVYLIGEAAPRLAEDLENVHGAEIVLVLSGDLETAVGDATRDADAGDVVLLAPACASFDAYRDYEARGEHFRALVEALR
ncbi:MAG TPA: UDP-N-acetylmuramoyl-L-alanine--D-glutamate ligase [Solirubrobacterales bacterium]